MAETQPTYTLLSPEYRFRYLHMERYREQFRNLQPEARAKFLYRNGWTKGRKHDLEVIQREYGLTNAETWEIYGYLCIHSIMGSWP